MEILQRRLIGIIGIAVLIAVGVAAIFYSTSPDQPSPEAATTKPLAPIPTTTLTPTSTSTLTPSLSPTGTPLSKPTPTSSSVPSDAPEILPSTPLTSSQVIPVYSFKVIRAFPHDPNAFTQGLIFEDGILYEGTGRRGQSTLRKVDLESGQVSQLRTLPDQFFGEGITIFGDRLIQLTWQSHLGFVYDKDSFEQLQWFSYPTEGWGITHDGQYLIMSDGTAYLYFLDPDTFAEVDRIEVTDGNGPVFRLNELEYIRGEIFANVWQTDLIARIKPDTGEVVGWIDLTGLLSPEDMTQPVDVLNGIAYDAQHERLFVTGKLWPKLFEIELTVE